MQNQTENKIKIQCNNWPLIFNKTSIFEKKSIINNIYKSQNQKDFLQLTQI